MILHLNKLHDQNYIEIFLFIIIITIIIIIIRFVFFENYLTK